MISGTLGAPPWERVRDRGGTLGDRVGDRGGTVVNCEGPWGTVEGSAETVGNRGRGVSASGFRLSGFLFRLGFDVLVSIQGFDLRVSIFKFRCLGFYFRVSSFGCRCCSFDIRASVFEFRCSSFDSGGGRGRLSSSDPFNCLGPFCHGVVFCFCLSGFVFFCFCCLCSCFFVLLKNTAKQYMIPLLE